MIKLESGTCDRLYQAYTEHFSRFIILMRVTFIFFLFLQIYSYLFFLIVMNSREIIYLKGGIWPSTSSSLLCSLKF